MIFSLIDMNAQEDVWDRIRAIIVGTVQDVMVFTVLY